MWAFLGVVEAKATFPCRAVAAVAWELQLAAVSQVGFDFLDHNSLTVVDFRRAARYVSD